MLMCRDVLAMGSDYIDDVLMPRERRSLRLHLLMCRHCRRYVRSLRLVAATAGQLPLPANEARVLEVLSVIPPSE